MASFSTASPWSRGPTIRTALVLGFAVIVGIWALAGSRFTSRQSALEARAVEVSARYLTAQDLLADARGQVLIASVLVRDALLDSGRERVRDYRREVDEAFSIAGRSLEQYVPVLDSTDERERLARLQRAVAELRAATLQVLGDGLRAPIDAGPLLRTRIMPRREAAMTVADELQTLNRNAFVQHQLEMARIAGLTQRQGWQTLGLALAASLAVGLLAIFYAGRLEGRIRLQRIVDQQNRRDLQRLSASLVTAQEEERRSIARELHDEVGQVLTAIKVEIALAESAAAGASPDAVLALSDARAIAERALHTVRDLSNLLHPPLLDDLGLVETLQWYFKGFRRRHGIKLTLAHDPGLATSSETTLAAYRIVQEALTNVARHAHATECRVTLRHDAGALVVTIEDDGRGFDTAEVDRPGARRGLGLLGIRERASQMDGSVEITSSRAEGTRVVVQLPAGGAAEPGQAGPVQAAIALEGAR